ncbi:hypothetical protein J437_LFUL003687 [Ladona fulva]|uniref:Cation-transporting ATPase n=1 Tax=Ladona fulva TaxID=123851 RepID=A0A8K0NXI4_LADFU|nr:hypothetical protein J437_LFUL003687 [Ladona fulva]
MKKTAQTPMSAAEFESSTSWSKMQTQSLLHHQRRADTTGDNGRSDMSSEDDGEHIKVDDDNEWDLLGYQICRKRMIASWIGIILTGGFLRLVFHWFPRLHLYSRHRRCSISKATKVLVVETFQKNYKKYYVKDIKTTVLHGLKSQTGLKPPIGMDEQEMAKSNERKIKFYLSNGTVKETESIRHFSCKKEVYVWDEDLERFIKLSGLETAMTNGDFHRAQGLTEQEQSLRQIAYGPNEILTPVQSLLTLLVLEVLDPFYVFQAFSLAVWCAEEYYYYAIAIFIMSFFGVTSSIFQTRKNQKQLKRTVTSSDVVTVIRRVEGAEQGNEVKEEILAKHLVPGDIIALPPHGCVMSCDAILLSGNVIVNESMLTGESVPVTKAPVTMDEEPFNEKSDIVRHSILFCGTKVLQTRFYGDQCARAVVIRTGFLTSKGQIVKTILHPPPVDYLFERDSYKFVGVLVGIATLGFISTVITKAMRGVDPFDIAIKALDLITIAVPPALPAAMTVGKMYAQRRLQKKGIYCINSRVINVSGSINCVCYDKTGTLTEDGLDMWGVVPVQSGVLQPPLRNFPLSRADGEKSQIQQDERFIVAMATCHSLTYLGGQLIGDPLDLKMFESTGWILEEPEMSETSQFDLLVPMVVRPSCKEVVTSDHGEAFPLEEGIIRQFQFSSLLQRMSVITRRLGSKNFSIYCKGSPEIIMSLSRPDTIPQGISTTLEIYTKKGYRVLALAWRPLPSEVTVVQVHRIKREQAETDFIFLGLIIFENRLKKATAKVIESLNKAKAKQIMVTGDNILTAISVAHECELVSTKQRIYQVLSSMAEHSNSNEIRIHNWTAKNIFKDDDIISLREGSKDGHFHSSLNDSVKSLLGDADVEKEQSDMRTTFAMTGNVWEEIRKNDEELLKRIVKCGAIYARMSPVQKQQLVQELQAAGYCVAMCGDGANDCGALKAAHTGISLSEAESSVASPFTSNGDDISCVPKVICEGRAALVTSFGIFKFMAVYSLVQFSSVILLYSLESNLTDFEFLYIDLFLVTVFAALFGLTEPPSSKKDIFPIPPSASLYSIYPIASIISQVFIMVIFQLVGYYGVRLFPWFIPFTYGKSFLGNDYEYSCYENYGVFSISIFQYIWMAVVFSRGAPHRKSLFTNTWLLLSLIVMGVINLIIVVYPPPFMEKLLELVIPPPLGDRFIIIPIAALNFFISLSIEWGVMENILEYGRGRQLWKKRQDRAIGNYHSSKSLKPLVPITAEIIPRMTERNHCSDENAGNLSTTITHL